MIDLPPSDLKAAEEKLLKDFREKVRRGLFNLTAECLGSPNLTILSALGVDAEATLLHIFEEEIQLLLNQKGGDKNVR